MIYVDRMVRGLMMDLMMMTISLTGTSVSFFFFVPHYICIYVIICFSYFSGLNLGIIMIYQQGSAPLQRLMCWLMCSVRRFYQHCFQY